MSVLIWVQTVCKGNPQTTKVAASKSFLMRLFSELTFRKLFHEYTLRVSNSLDPGQDRRSVGSDLGPNSLQRLSADNKSHR